MRRIIMAAATALLLLTPAEAQAVDCQFVLGFAIIAQAVPDKVGTCLEDQHFAPNGDAQQQTSGGLLAWRKQDNWTAFTDGYRTWINGPNGMQARLNTERFPWENDSAGSGGSVRTGAKGAILFADTSTIRPPANSPGQPPRMRST